MSLRINSNVSALNTHRNMTATSNLQAKNLEKLSSGLDINRGSDGPAKLQISEQLRAQTAGLKQAIDNSEMAISVMQTAEGALDEVNRALVQARQLAVHAANTGTNDEFMQLSDQQELDNILHQINTIAQNTQYGKKSLLDGSRSGNGVTTGADLEFVSGGTEAKSSGPGGHAVNITQAATRSEITGVTPLNQMMIDEGEQIVITEGGRSVNFKTHAGETVQQNMNHLEEAIKSAGLNLDLIRSDSKETAGDLPQKLIVRHKEYGSEHSFQVATNTAGLLSKEANVPDMIKTGLDIEGEIASERAHGQGQILTGGPGGNAAGISVRFTGEEMPNQGLGGQIPSAAPAAAGTPVEPAKGEASAVQAVKPSGGFAGTVTFMQNSMNFQIGQNTDHNTSVSFESIRGSELSNGVSNESGFRSLNEISVMDTQKALDSMRMIDRAIEEVAARRGEMGAFQKNLLESNLSYLRIAHENTLSSESVVRDADIANEMANFTRNQIMMESSVAMLAQANARPLQVLKLLQ